MRLFNTLIILAGGALLLAPSGVRADTPGHHPHYIHARGDLKEALAILQGPAEPNVAANLRAAAGEIQGAIRELNRAAYADAKDVYSRAHPDSHPDRVGRFRNLEKLISRARQDLGAEEDNPAALAWRDGAFRHIDAALDFVHRAARDAHLDHELGW